MIADGKGAFYGTTNGGGESCDNEEIESAGDGCGTIFRLTPPTEGQTAWTETVLHRFKTKGDGSYPHAGLIADKQGALYGTTEGGGRKDKGIVFKLTPPAKGHTAWTETVLYRFKGGGDGGALDASLSADAEGALYSTTSETVFKLTPPSGSKTAWTETALYRFRGGRNGSSPVGQLIMDKDGALYGTTELGGISDIGKGIVFKLSPPSNSKNSWKETILYSFKGGTDGESPYAGLIGRQGRSTLRHCAFRGCPPTRGSIQVVGMPPIKEC
jgi:uncharacterized repeat protein (TIGR03803 family)